MNSQLSYKKAGVDISSADQAKREMATALASSDARVLSKLGSFSALFDGKFPEYKHPVLVLKIEEPGSKQKLAMQHRRIESLCYDLINHLVNDVIVMGATPLAVQDAIICGKLEKDVVTAIVNYIAQASKAQGCYLAGGETSEQPGVLEAGTYILVASMLGVVEKEKIVDGSKCRKGDIVLALPSNGLHTNGYSLVRALISSNQQILQAKIGSTSFLDAILLPHTCYFQVLKDLLGLTELHAMAHITGGGIAGNLNRVLPSSLDARIDLAKIKILPIFSFIREQGNVTEEDMLRTFNMGVGMTLVVSPDSVSTITKHINERDMACYQIGEIVDGSQSVEFTGKLNW